MKKSLKTFMLTRAFLASIQEETGMGFTLPNETVKEANKTYETLVFRSLVIKQ